MEGFRNFANILFLRRLHRREYTSPPTKQILGALFRRLWSLSLQPTFSDYDDHHQVCLLRSVLVSCEGPRDPDQIPDQQESGSELEAFSAENLAFLCDVFNLPVGRCQKQHECGNQSECHEGPERLEHFDDEKAATLLDIPSDAVIRHRTCLDGILMGQANGLDDKSIGLDFVPESCKLQAAP